MTTIDQQVHPLTVDATVTRGLYARAAWIVLAILALFTMLLVQGLLPGYIQNESVATLSEGAIFCEHALGFHALTSTCHSFGYPLGYPLLTNGPVIMFGALLMRLPGIGAPGAYTISLAVVDAVALAGGYALARRLGASRAVALWGGWLYLIAPTVIGMQGFPGTYSGYVLLPCYALADLVLLRSLEGGRSRRLALVLAAYVLVRTGALFMDGYSFVASALVSACLWGAWAGRGGRGRRIWLAAVLMLFANAVAYLIYSAYVPGAFAGNPPGVFRSMGLDVATLVAPTQNEWFAHVFGIAWNPSRLWGDGTNYTYNYVGFFCLALAIWGVRGRYPVALGCAGLIALVLSIGPALKIDSTRAQPIGAQPTYQSYLMPSSDATAELPWDRLFWKVPGVKSMRAAYRWFGVTRLALVMLAALGVERLLRRPGPRHRRRRGQMAALALATLATLELLPNMPQLLRGYRADAQQLAQRNDILTTDLRTLTRPGERVFFLSYDGTDNDWVVNTLAPLAGLRAYNAGGDKDVSFAVRSWPQDITPLASPNVTAQDVYGALRAGNLDAVILPFFDLRWSAYSWPPTAQERTLAQRAFAPLYRDPRLYVHRLGWLASVTLRRTPPGGSGRVAR